MYQRNFPQMRELCSLQGQLFQIKDEVREVQAEVDDIRKACRMGWPCSSQKLLIEVMDVIHSCETMFDVLGVSQEQLDRAKDEVIRKNKARNYYKED